MDEQHVAADECHTAQIPEHSRMHLGNAVHARIEEHLHPLGVLPALQSLLYILVVALFLMTFTVQPFRIPSESMEPTLLVGDFLLVDKQSVEGSAGGLLPVNAIVRRDVVVFHYPLDAKMHLVKRVIGLPGERLHLREGRVYVNGQLLDEPYTVYRPMGPDVYRDNFPTMESPNPGVVSAWWMQLHALIHEGDLIVPPDSYFVMGDNRNNSEDSRYWGLVPRAAIVGKPLLVYFSVWEKSRDQVQSNPPNATLSSFARWDRLFKVIR